MPVKSGRGDGGSVDPPSCRTRGPLATGRRPAEGAAYDQDQRLHWTKLGTVWEGVIIDDLLAAASLDEPPAPYLMAHCDGGYTTNLPLEDLLDGKGLVAIRFDGEPLAPEHGGPARLLIPHLYFWKSAKWVRRLRFMEHDEPGFWESLGYHIYGDPWREQRYDGD
jgi:DMSO/TMAO reductase YedYZ molybdopterin-dependent catalytic subunit